MCEGSLPVVKFLIYLLMGVVFQGTSGDYLRSLDLERNPPLKASFFLLSLEDCSKRMFSWDIVTKLGWSLHFPRSSFLICRKEGTGSVISLLPCRSVLRARVLMF